MKKVLIFIGLKVIELVTVILIIYGIKVLPYKYGVWLYKQRGWMALLETETAFEIWEFGAFTIFTICLGLAGIGVIGYLLILELIKVNWRLAEKISENRRGK